MDRMDVYRELSKKLLMEHSKLMPKIWETVCSPDEAAVINALPATAEELAGRFGKTEEDMLAVLDSLFHKGVVFEAVRNGVTTYRMPRHVIQFHDATILWKEAPQALMDLWVEFTETEYPGLLELVTQIKMPSFMRVIPIGESIAVKNQVLAHEDALKMLESANSIAVTDCVCRKLMKKCDAPLQVCLQINRGAEYNIRRGTGRRIDISEAREILERSRKAGLVPMTENTTGRSNVICNCCTCCCGVLRAINELGIPAEQFQDREIGHPCLREQLARIEPQLVGQGDDDLGTWRLHDSPLYLREVGGADPDPPSQVVEGDSRFLPGRTHGIPESGIDLPLREHISGLGLRMELGHRYLQQSVY